MLLLLFLPLFSLRFVLTQVPIDLPLQIEQTKQYQPNWTDLDSRPLPQWYDEAKVGIFLHWGLYCVPGFISEWFWAYWRSGNHACVEYMKKNYPPGFTYQDFAPMFKAEFFDPDSWARLFAKSGAKYIVLTSKHHEGYTLFPSKKSFGWNSVDVGPKRDLVGELSQAVRKQGLKFGVYHSLYEWYNPIYREDKKNNFTTKHFVTEKLWPDLKQLVFDYKPSVIWVDGDWEALETYWKSKEFLAWLYSDSLVRGEIVVNDRWGKGITGRHGDFFNFADRFNNKTLQKHKWENAFTVDSKAWGYRKNIDVSQVLSTKNLLNQLVTTVSCGGNVLINIGPTQEGTVPVIFQDRLLSVGEWLSTNGEAIYKSSPWFRQNDTINTNVWYTCTKTTYNATHPTAIPSSEDDITAFYAITLEWPEGNVLELKDVTSYLMKDNYQVELLDNTGVYLEWHIVNELTHIRFPDMSTLKSEIVWTVKFTKK